VKLLKDLLENLVPNEALGANGERAISGICIDSRLSTANTLFIAIRGSSTDGHLYIGKAIDLGATVVLCETLPADLKDHVAYFQVNNTMKLAGIIAGRFFGEPSGSLKLIGITGTNGKTSTATMLYQLFTDLGYSCGLISTVKVIIGETEQAATHTTPDPISLQRLLSSMLEQGCSHVFMEVSSHACDQDRISGLRFEGAVFTNISHDHLDYHKTFNNYINSKKKFFDNLDIDSFALVNADDKRGEVMLQNTRAHKHRFSLRTLAEFKAKILDNSLSGLVMDIGGKEFYSPLVGEFNAYNLLTAYATAVLCDEDPEKVLVTLSKVQGAEGRFELLYHKDRQVSAVVDYAHTPDALEKVLETLQRVLKNKGRIISVVGCGGDRDRTKRPLMGNISVKYSEKVIFTSDNPRSEDPEAIIDEMMVDLDKNSLAKVLRIVDRSSAIKTALMLADKGDIVLVAGKGHEKYQEIKGIRYPFDDKQIVQDIFRGTSSD